MIKTEIYVINGRSFTRTWSDTGYVMRDGVVYEEANDPTELNRVYEEVDEPIVVDDEDVVDDIDSTTSSILDEKIRLATRYASV